MHRTAGFFSQFSIILALAFPVLAALLSGSGGGLIAFSRGAANARGEIYAMNADSSDLRWLTHNNYETSRPPGLRMAQIVFSLFHFDGSNHDIFIIDTTDANQRPITADSLDNWWPDWLF